MLHWKHACLCDKYLLVCLPSMCYYSILELRQLQVTLGLFLNIITILCNLKKQNKKQQLPETQVEGIAAQRT